MLGGGGRSMEAIKISAARQNVELPNGFEDHDEENIVELQEDWGDEYKDVVTFLCGLHLNEYVEMFVNQGINLDIFLNLNEEDLCHIGMTNSSHRESLLKGISQLRLNKCKASSEVLLSNFSGDELNAVMTNTVKHLTLMHAALAHTRLSLRSGGAHNTLASLSMSSAALLDRLCCEARLQAEIVSNETNALLAKDPQAKTVPKTNWRKNLFFLSSVGAVCALLIFAQRKTSGG